MNVIIIGGGIGGLSLALSLEQLGLSCRVYETAPELKPLGVGISLLPHAMRELKRISENYAKIAGFSLDAVRPT